MVIFLKVLATLVLFAFLVLEWMAQLAGNETGILTVKDRLFMVAPIVGIVLVWVL
jgi:hypothetical protein